MELRNLVIAGKDAAELLLCLKKVRGRGQGGARAGLLLPLMLSRLLPRPPQELDILGNIILHTSTGSSQVDMIVSRLVAVGIWANLSVSY